MNKCMNCGYQIPSEYQFCPTCGRKTIDNLEPTTLLNLRNHFTILGVTIGDNVTIENSYISYSSETEADVTCYINLKVTMPINETVIFDICFQDSNGETVLNSKSSSNTLLVEENEILKVPFTLPSAKLSGYNIAIIKYNDNELLCLDLVPDVISVKIDNSWFNMRLSWGYYNACLTFLPWWILMPNTTSRDVRYTNWYIKLDEVAGISLQEKCIKVNDFITRLKSKSNANINLATSRRSPEWLDKHCGTSDFYFDTSNVHTNIYVELSINDYLKSIKSKNSSLVAAFNKRHGILTKDGIPMSESEMIQYINSMLQSRYDGFLY